MENRACVYKALLGPGFGCAETVVTPCLTDAVIKGVKLRGRLLRDGNVSICTTRIVYVKWDLSCSEMQAKQKQASLTLFIFPL